MLPGLEQPPLVVRRADRPGTAIRVRRRGRPYRMDRRGLGDEDPAVLACSLRGVLVSRFPTR
eukprot:8713791-Alexandrium_andersonii.AAC.1